MQALNCSNTAARAARNPADVAIYHLSIKAVSRAVGRSATAAAAYRSASLIADTRTGEIHDYQRRTGVEASFIVAPDGAAWAQDRAALWNAVEAAERRKDAKVAREYQVALPHELTPRSARRSRATSPSTSVPATALRPMSPFTRPAARAMSATGTPTS